MVKIGNVVLNGTPRVAVSVSDKERSSLIKSANADIIEVRVDKFKRLSSDYVKGSVKARRELNIPLILTVRSRDEGGGKNIPDERKFEIFKSVIPLVNAVDVELRYPLVSDVVDISRRNKKTVIISWHNLKFTPNNKILKDVLNKAKKKGADVVKIAAKANKAEDVNRLMRFTQDNRSKNIVVIALGSIGTISRVVFPIAGSLITYSYIDKPSGLGQIPLNRLQEQLCLFYPQYKRC